jgi:hypothetical protein
MPRQLWRRKPTEIEVEYFDPTVHVPDYVEMSEIHPCWKEDGTKYPCWTIVVGDTELVLHPPTFIVFHDGKPEGFIHPDTLKKEYSFVQRVGRNPAFDWHAGVDEEGLETPLSGLGLKVPGN